MIDLLVSGLLLVVGLLAGDLSARPHAAQRWRLRSVQGMAVLLGAGAFLFGIYLGIIGAWVPAMVLVFLSMSVFPLISNIKRQVLGEPLVFTDFALIGAVFQHPHFYISALKPWQIAAILAGLAMLVGVAGFFSTGDLEARAIGLGIAAAAAVWLKVMAARPVWARLADRPDIDRDVGEHGLIATLFVHWRLWARLPRDAPHALPPITSDVRQLVVVIQCESFADPADLFDDPGEPLAGLARARALAWSSGRLMVSGFGAYTMRTEFGALFGIGEDALGLRRFDPFLTATSAANLSLPNRLAGRDWTKVFLHPHDMRFYGRDRLMPAAGFDTLIGESAFSASDHVEGRYVTDAALCDKLLELADAGADGSTLIYAVTIENHGPWASDEHKSLKDNKDAYLRLLRRSDAMLSRLIEQLPKLGRPTTLCFFGDHRPSIPKVCTPGGDKHTPFVILKFGANGTPIPAPGPPQDLTPAALHHEILKAVASW